MNKSAKDVSNQNEEFRNLTFWSFTYYLLKGVSAKIFSHGVFVIIIMMLTIIVCLLSKQSNNIDQNLTKEVKAHETNSKAK